MNPSLEHLAAVAAAGVPGLLPVSVGPSPDDDADFRSAVVSDSTDRRWRVRSPLTDEAAIRLASEHAVLRAFSPALRAKLPFHMPTIVGSVEDRGRRAFIYSHLVGRPIPIDELTELADVAPLRPQPPSAAPVPGVTEQLGGLIAAIHTLPRAMVMDADLPAYSAEQCRRRMLNELDQAATTGRIPATLLRRWESALEDRTLWRFSTRVVHGDLHEDNLVVEGNRITAVTGWTDVHVGDPATDLAWLIGASDTSFAEAVVAAYSRAVAGPPDPLLLRRAHLEAEFALARWLVRGLSRGLPELVEDAQDMLRILESDLETYGREQASDRAPRAEDTVADHAEHARPTQERAAQQTPPQAPDTRSLQIPAARTPAAEVPEADLQEASRQERVRREGRRRAELDAAHSRSRLSGDLLEDGPVGDPDGRPEGEAASGHGAHPEATAAASVKADPAASGPQRTGATVAPVHRTGSSPTASGSRASGSHAAGSSPPAADPPRPGTAGSPRADS